VDLRRPLRQVHLGGGTPNFLEPAEMRRLLGTLRERLNPHADTEWAIECDPRTLEGAYVEMLLDLGMNRFLMLRNHGLLTVAKSIPDAFLQMYLFESACAIQLRAHAASSEVVSVDPKIVAGATMMAKQVTRSAGGALAWPGLLRKLDRIDRSYRD